ncbi:bcl-2-modifying factor [Gadus morhua]|uniref:Bcl-2-modifying factor-like n=1 Tax=Gadus morhua TaxID=8049 RepID=A0A8C5AI27_GADMO|nr:bcl-2-modifying factor-like [Gadus morhua]
MDDDEDDVFEPDSYLSHTTVREIKCKDRGTQTNGPALVSANGMLQPRRLFHGNAGFRSHLSAPFELGGEQQEEQQRGMEREMDAELWRMQQQQQQQQQQHQRQPAALSVEAHIGQKLRVIGDQFHGENLQQFHRNQRNQGGVWWRRLLHLLFDGGLIAGWVGAGPR